jgi:hypothetical protein
MTLENLAEMYRDKMIGYDLVGEYEAGVPTYKIRLKGNAQRRQELPIIPQFILRLISLGIQSQTEIEKILGLNPEFARKAIVHLNRNQLINYHSDSASVLTDKGKRALEEAIAAMHITNFDIQVDGLTQEIAPLSHLEHGPVFKKNGGWALHPSPKSRPTLESLNDRLTTLEKIFKEQWEDEDLNTNDHLIEILGIERSTLMYKPVNVLLFHERKTKQTYFRVFEGYNEVTEYNQILKRRERNGSPVIPDDLLVMAADAVQSELVQRLRPELEKAEQVDIKLREKKAQKDKLQDALSDATNKEKDQPELITGKTKRIQELEAEVKQLEAAQISSKNRIVRNQEHRMLLKEALSSSQQRVVIVSPWIKRDATDKEVISLIANAVKRNVKVLIGYGMPPRRGQTKSDYIDEWVDKELKKIQKLRPTGKNLTVKWLGNTHEKILICDNRFFVLTSFNFLSYRGNQGFRKEQGIYNEDPNLIQDVLSDVLKRFKK